MSKLSEIQKGLKAPKGQFNAFGKYKYRSCEDILEAAKPLLGDCTLQMSDEVVLVGDRYYVKATVSLYGDGEPISVSAFARESLAKKGMDESQITGTASSYARKYALNGLFCIDDTKDADTMDNSTQNSSEPKPAPKPKPRAPILLATIKSETWTKWLGGFTSSEAAFAAIGQKYIYENDVHAYVTELFAAKATL